MREIQPDELPLRFNRPPSWPQPSLQWELENIGAPIPAGWVPDASSVPAPRGWVFWVRNGRTWNTWSNEQLSAFNRRAWMHAGIAAGGLILTVAGAQAGAGGFVVFWGAILFGIVNLVRVLIARQNAKRYLVGMLAVAAAERRLEIARIEYEQYLKAAA